MVNVLLQQRSLDIVKRTQIMDGVREQLKEIMDKGEDWHKRWFQLASDVADEVGTAMPATYMPQRVILIFY